MIDAWYRYPLLRPVVVLGGAILVAVLVYLLVIRDGDVGAPADGRPVEVSEDDLAELADEVGHPIYWVGEQQGATLEATRLPDDQVYVRYVEDGDIGDPRPRFLTVGTYPVEDAFATLETVAEGDDVTHEKLEDGALAVQSDAAPSSVYVAYPNQDLQIEIYDPNSRRAFQTATSGAVRPVE